MFHVVNRRSSLFDRSEHSGHQFVPNYVYRTHSLDKTIQIHRFNSIWAYRSVFYLLINKV